MSLNRRITIRCPERDSHVYGPNGMRDCRMNMLK